MNSLRLPLAYAFALLATAAFAERLSTGIASVSAALRHDREPDIPGFEDRARHRDRLPVVVAKLDRVAQEFNRKP